MKKQLFLSLLFMLGFLLHVDAEIERRAAFDLGSGSLKLLVADVDSETQHVLKYIYSTTIKVPLSDDLAKSPDASFSTEIQHQVKDVMSTLSKQARLHRAQRYFGVATEAFRLANNGKQLIAEVAGEQGFPIHIISQQEEAELGFASAVELSNGDPDTAVVWDIGNGSFQVTWKGDETVKAYLGHFGKTPMRNLIIKDIQGKSLENTHSPNPISAHETALAKDLLRSQLEDIPEDLRIKLRDPATQVYGIGAVHHGNIAYTCHRKIYTLQNVDELLSQRFDLDDSHFDVESPEFWVSDLIFVSTVMSHLDITKVIDIKAFGDPQVVVTGSTVGIIVWPKFWNLNDVKMELPMYLSTRIYFVKGGETPSSVLELWQGQDTDESLTEKGRASAAKLATELQNLELSGITYTSPLLRASETADIVLEILNLPPAVSACDINQRKITPFEKKNSEYVTNLYREATGDDQKQTSDGIFEISWGGWDDSAVETNAKVRERMMQFIKMVANEHPGEKVLAVTHTDNMRLLLRLATGAPVSKDYKVWTHAVLGLELGDDDKLNVVYRDKIDDRVK